ncbi:MAG: carboxypeptidase-like regulatory domain-containing protein [Euryarchaeota archaeon]|nr:carboxypeptidase-like regulatory domain-containing protein [Euryarchaeota archaeon]
MGSRWLWPTLTLLLITGLSGCFGGDDPVNVDEEETEAPEAVATDDTGSINGQVVTEDFTPLPKVGVSVTKQGRLVDGTTTDKEGRYTLNDLAPDTYVLQTLAPGYEQVAVPVEVVAGTVAKKDLRLTSLADLANQSYMVPDEWTGFLSCGLGTRVITISACSTSAENVSADPNDDFSHIFDAEAGLDELVFGLTWSKSGGVSADKLLVIVDIEITQESGDKVWREFARVSGASPVVFRINDDTLEERRANYDSVKFSTWNETHRVLVRVFPPFETPPVVIYQQPFTLYWEQYYGQRAPEGHSPIPDQ